jgi:hypothetical protein
MEIETNSSHGNVARKQLAPATAKLLKAIEAHQLLNVSVSWLAKARMRGDGPPFIKIGRNVRTARRRCCSGCGRISAFQPANSNGEYDQNKGQPLYTNGYLRTRTGKKVRMFYS